MKNKVFRLFLILIVWSISGMFVSCGKKQKAEDSGSEVIETELQQESAMESMEDTEKKSTVSPETEETEIESYTETEGEIVVAIGVETMDAELDSYSVEEAPASAETASVPENESESEVPDFTDSDGQVQELKWEEFYALSGKEKDLYSDSFESDRAFFDWVKRAQAQFKEDYPEVEIGADGSIDLSKIK